MKRILVWLSVTLLFAACAKVPITNRKQMNMMPESEMMSMALTEYNTFLKANPPVNPADPDAQMVKNIGGKISVAVMQYLTQYKMADRVKGYKWEFNLVTNKEANAWCMPGGKVVVYSGLLPITKDETGLAFVMGHEIAHAVARHGNERMSQMLMVQAGSAAMNMAIQNKSPETQALFNTAYGLGTTAGAILPYSRLHESEADKLGLVFMALAGYDPRKAPEVWKRMAAIGGAKPPAWMSTHPSDAQRMKDMTAYMPQAMKYYKAPK